MRVKELYEKMNELESKMKGEIVIIIGPYSLQYNDSLVQTGDQIFDLEFKEEIKDAKPIDIKNVACYI